MKTVSVVFIGHVDAGKSTTCGQILLGTGQIDRRTVDKYTELAAKNNRGSWWLAYILDTSDEERSKGKTVELGRADFFYNEKAFVILDAPGHKNYVPNMITGALLADFAVLIVSARRGEFEAGFERGGQTREHALLAKSAGVKKLVVAVNKMDDSSVGWAEERFVEVREKIAGFLKGYGYRGENSVAFVPLSGQTGANVFERPTEPAAAWVRGEPLLQVFDAVWDELRGESPTPACGEKVVLVESREEGDFCRVKVLTGSVDDGDELALPGGLTWFKLALPTPAGKGVSVLCSVVLSRNEDPAFEPVKQLPYEFSVLANEAAAVVARDRFDAKVVVTELAETSVMLMAGFECVFHHVAGTVGCEVLKLIAEQDPKSKRIINKKILFAKNKQRVICRLRLDKKLPVLAFVANKPLGRFVLRAGNSTVGVGVIVRLL